MLWVRQRVAIYGTVLRSQLTGLRTVATAGDAPAARRAPTEWPTAAALLTTATTGALYYATLQPAQGCCDKFFAALLAQHAVVANSRVCALSLPSRGPGVQCRGPIRPRRRGGGPVRTTCPYVSAAKVLP